MMPHGRRLFSVSVGVLLPLFTLEECDRNFIPVPAGNPPPISQPAQGYSNQPLVPSTMQASWTEPAGVSSKGEALTECQQRAEQYARERGRTVVMINVVPAVKGWLCVFQEY